MDPPRGELALRARATYAFFSLASRCRSWARLSSLSKEKTQWAAAPEVEIDEMRVNQLRALGYVVDPRKLPARQGADAPAQVEEAPAERGQGEPAAR